MANLWKLSVLMSCVSIKMFAAEEIVISDESYNKIHSHEFVTQKKSFAEAPSLFEGKLNFDIPTAVAFEDSREKIRLAPGDIIKISEELTFGDWGGSSSLSQVAEEDFVLSDGQAKKPEEAAKTPKSIKFSRTSL